MAQQASQVKICFSYILNLSSERAISIRSQIKNKQV